MNDAQKFQRLAKWRRVKRIGLMIVIAVAVLMVVTPLAYKLTQSKAAKESNQISAILEATNTMMSPNIHVSDRVLSNTTIFGGTVMSHRYKSIEGQRVPWSTSQGDYSWLPGASELSDGTVDETETKQGMVSFDRETQRRIPEFFNLAVRKPNLKPTQELKQVSQAKGAVAEVAMTFKRPITSQQILSRLPTKLHATWYWAGVTGKMDPTSFQNHLVGLNAETVPGTATPKLTADDYREFKSAVKKIGQLGLDWRYNGVSVTKGSQTFIRQNPQLSTAKFSGIIVTGRTEDFKALNQATWIAASSLGYSAPRDPVQLDR